MITNPNEKIMSQKQFRSWLKIKLQAMENRVDKTDEKGIIGSLMSLVHQAKEYAKTVKK